MLSQDFAAGDVLRRKQVSTVTRIEEAIINGRQKGQSGPSPCNGPPWVAADLTQSKKGSAPRSEVNANLTADRFQQITTLPPCRPIPQSNAAPHGKSSTTSPSAFGRTSKSFCILPQQSRTLGWFCWSVVSCSIRFAT